VGKAVVTQSLLENRAIARLFVKEGGLCEVEENCRSVSLFAWRSIDTKSPLLEWMYPPLDATQFESRKYCSSGFSSLLSISELI
jgi:hypothetical protein